MQDSFKSSSSWEPSSANRNIGNSLALVARIRKDPWQSLEYEGPTASLVSSCIGLKREVGPRNNCALSSAKLSLGSFCIVPCMASVSLSLKDRHSLLKLASDKVSTANMRYSLFIVIGTLRLRSPMARQTRFDLISSLEKNS